MSYRTSSEATARKRFMLLSLIRPLRVPLSARSRFAAGSVTLRTFQNEEARK